MTKKTEKKELVPARNWDSCVQEEILADEIREDRDVWRTCASDRTYRPSMRPVYWR